MEKSELELKEFLSAFEERLAGALATPSYICDADNRLDAAMRYATLDGGKRVRPTLMFLSASAVAKQLGKPLDADAILPLAVGLELIHNYSLVHDDLPAMDNDALRRGKPTVHKAFGEANAILTGDMLLSRAASVLLDADRAAAKEIASAAELMVYGQYYDLSGVDSEEAYLDMYALKTGAMIVAAVRAGAIVAGADGALLERLGEYAQSLGLAFQLADDLLESKQESSLVAVVGHKRVEELLALHTAKAISHASSLTHGSALSAFAEKLYHRTK